MGTAFLPLGMEIASMRLLCFDIVRENGEFHLKILKKLFFFDCHSILRTRGNSLSFDSELALPFTNSLELEKATHGRQNAATRC